MSHALMEVTGLEERMEQDKIRVTVLDPTTLTDVPNAVPPLWRVTVRLGDRMLRLPYYVTDSHLPPDPAEIMRELIEAARTIEDSESMVTWAGLPVGTPEEDVDLKAQHTYVWYRDQAQGLRRVLGGLYDVYLRATAL